MKFIFYIFLFSQLFNFLGVFAEKVKEDPSGMNPVFWEKMEENKSKPLKKIIWKSYKQDENYFTNENKEGFSVNKVSGAKSAWISSRTRFAWATSNPCRASWRITFFPRGGSGGGSGG